MTELIAASSTPSLANGIELNRTSSNSIAEKYLQERLKRLREDGNAQFINPAHHQSLARFHEDPWSSAITPNPGLERTKNGDRFEVVIIGAGFGGLMFAARLMKAGIKDIILVDSAGGFGGTWYWNRYPGLMCDVESYIYMPMLEELGYMPKHKYSSGLELRQYAERFAEKFELHNKAIFRSTVNDAHWDESSGEWTLKLNPVDRNELNVRSQFVIVTTGLINTPKVPNLEGLNSFNGHSFHTSRWDFDYTGGSATDSRMTNLKDKRVGIIGTGATAIQLVPQLAQSAGQLYVFQRTPSAVDVRNNSATDPARFESEVSTSGSGWQRRRAQNFDAVCSDELGGEEDLVNDAWTKMRTFSAVLGTTNRPADMAKHVAAIQALDSPRQQRIRDRVDQVVKDKETAEKLKPWYAGWCKRPCFHDEYLPAFNRSNVTLVDTDGKGIDKVTEAGPVVNGIEYPLDLLIFSTGYIIAMGDSPAGRSGFKAYGKKSKSMDEKWVEGITTLHGVLSDEFPNFFFPGPSQAGASANIVSTLDILSEHIVFIISEAKKKSPSGRVIIEADKDAAEKWASGVAARAGAFAALAGCTPSYFNAEGASDKPKSTDEMLKAARGAPWGDGVVDFSRVIGAWRAEGNLAGLKITKR